MIPGSLRRGAPLRPRDTAAGCGRLSAPLLAVPRALAYLADRLLWMALGALALLALREAFSKSDCFAFSDHQLQTIAERTAWSCGQPVPRERPIVQYVERPFLNCQAVARACYRPGNQRRAGIIQLRCQPSVTPELIALAAHEACHHAQHLAGFDFDRLPESHYEEPAQRAYRNALSATWARRMLALESLMAEHAGERQIGSQEKTSVER